MATPIKKPPTKTEVRTALITLARAMIAARGDEITRRGVYDQILKWSLEFHREDTVLQIRYLITHKADIKDLRSLRSLVATED